MATLNPDHPLAAVFATMLALIVPAIILGRSVTGAAAVLTILLAFALPTRRQSWAAFRATLSGHTARLIYLTSAVWLVGLLSTTDVQKSLGTELRLLVFIASAGFIWAAMSAHRDAVAVYMKVLVSCCAVLGALAVFDLTVEAGIIHFIRGYVRTDIEAVILFKASASSAVLLIPVLIWAAHRLRGAWSAAAILAIGCQVALVFLTGNRAALAGLLFAVLVVGLLLAMSTRSAKTRMIVAAIVLGCIGLAFIWLFHTPSWVIWPFHIHKPWMPENYRSLDLALPLWLVDAPRQSIWMHTWNTTEEWRWFGVGINTIDTIPGARNMNDTHNIKNIPLHPHNWIVEIIAETGVFGFVAMSGTILYCSFSYVRQFLGLKEPAMLALIAVWAGYWGSGLFNFSYWSSWWQVSFLAATVICLAGRESLTATGQK